ncbi:MAG TPA: alpha/beta hydrolase [Gemmatimonadales bacterium]|nr:alpha/beta hydrolase [Gemmatimonadales bacterium]
MPAPRWIAAACVGLGALGALACETLDPTAPGNLVPRTVAEDANLPAIEMNGSRFHLETFGNPANPAIVFLHGGPGGDYRSMLRMAQRYNGYGLADDYFLVFWDQRGSGLSQRHDRDVLTLDVYVDDLNTLVDRYSPGRPVILIGVSWGGMFATRYINQHPERVAGAVLIEPGPLDGATMERLKSDLTEFELGSEVLNDIAWNTQFLSPDDHARMDFERTLGLKDAQPRSHLSTVDPEPSWRMGAAASRYLMEDGQDGNGKFVYDFTTNLSAYTTPVLFVAGAWSEILGASLQQEQVQRYPSASLQVVDGAGHDVAWVKAAEVLTQVRTYLDALKGGSQ